MAGQLSLFSAEPLEVRALRLWRVREMTFPAFVRRMNPDALDYAVGNWDRILVAAIEEAA